MASTLRGMITSYFPDVWPVIIIITVICCSLRISYLILNREKFCFYKELFMLLFILYVMCLFEVVTIQDDNYGLSNFIPFREIFRYRIGSRLFIKNIIGNILLFLPYGYFASDYLKVKKPFWIFLLTMIVSLTIEIVQLNIGRTFDVDDIILNTLGGGVGFFIYYVLERGKERLPAFCRSDGFINLVVIVVLIIGIVYLFDLHVMEFIS